MSIWGIFSTHEVENHKVLYHGSGLVYGFCEKTGKKWRGIAHVRIGIFCPYCKIKIIRGSDD